MRPKLNDSETLDELSRERSNETQILQTLCSNICKANYPANARLVVIGRDDAGFVLYNCLYAA
jgi:hypothetical protein